VVDAARSGEEYELALTAPAGVDEGAFAAEFGVPLTRIGVVEPRGPERAPDVELRVDGRCVDLPAGHDHFSR
jgi:thiamine monophosphate kinase